MMIPGVGGVFAGLLGSIGTRVVNYYEKKQEIKAEESKREHDFRMATAGYQIQKETTEIQADATLRAASYQHDSAAAGASQIVINIIRLTRPVITAYALVFETIIFFAAWASNNLRLQEMVVLAVLETAACSISWWFGDRSASMALKGRGLNVV